MKILFTLSSFGHLPLFTKTLLTDLDIPQIEAHLQLYEGFDSVVEGGSHLLFWDINCCFSDVQELIGRIESIPTAAASMQEETGTEPCVLRIQEMNPGNADEPCYPDWDRCFLYRLTRHEQGASGFGALVVWASAHPWLMVFVGGFIWDAVKYLTVRVVRWFREKTGQKGAGSGSGAAAPAAAQTVWFDVGRFYREFCRMTGLKKADCQIVYLKKVRGGQFTVHVRTIRNDRYVVTCTGRGRISFLKQEH